MFPVEIIEILLKYSNGSDIVNFRRVSKTWNSIIIRLSENTDLWKIKCKNEIPLRTCRSILSKLYPITNWLNFNQSKNNRLKWLKIYQSWMTWRNVKETNISLEKLEPFFIKLPNVTITCLTVSENFLAVGSSDGFIAFYDLDISIKEPIFIADQMSHVSNIQFLRYDEAFTAVSTSHLDHIMAWNIRTKEAYGRRCPGKLISTNYGCLCIAMNHQLRILNKNKKCLHEFSPQSGTIAALVAEGDQALLLTDHGSYFKVNMNESDIEYIEEHIQPPTERVCKYYLFGSLVTVCITRNGLLGISINRKPWVMNDIFSKLHGIPTAVLFYSDILVLGLDSGSVYVYRVDDIESLDTWDFRSENSTPIIVDNQGIVSLDIMDRPNKQYLLAATAEKVNIIEIKYNS